MLDHVSDRVSEILKAALALSPEERERLARELLESVDGEDVYIDPEELERIEAEAEAIASGRVRAEPWEAVYERLQAKLRK